MEAEKGEGRQGPLQGEPLLWAPPLRAEMEGAEEGDGLRVVDQRDALVVAVEHARLGHLRRHDCWMLLLCAMAATAMTYEGCKRLRGIGGV